MAIVNAQINSTDTTLITVPASKKYAITTVLVCNNQIDDGSGANDTSFDMHVIPNGQSKANRNLILNDLKVAAADTFTFNVERLILEADDRLVFVGANPTNLSCTVSYLEV
tara:strand:+ start:691 stop:1023 length:333 start_codon:yes stop_codon:yes gene_type:complete